MFFAIKGRMISSVLVLSLYCGVDVANAVGRNIVQTDGAEQGVALRQIKFQLLFGTHRYRHRYHHRRYWHHNYRRHVRDHKYVHPMPNITSPENTAKQQDLEKLHEMRQKLNEIK